MLVTVNCYLTASPSPLEHQTSMMLSFSNLSVMEADLILCSGCSFINIHASILSSLSPLLSSIISLSSPASIILPQATSPGSLLLVREFIYTGQCKGTLAQLEDALQILSLLGVQVQSEVLGDSVGGIENGREVPINLGNRNLSYAIEDVEESTAAVFNDVRLPVVETYDKELFPSYSVEEDLKSSNIKMESTSSFKKEISSEDCQKTERFEVFTSVPVSIGNQEQEAEWVSKYLTVSKTNTDILLSDEDLEELNEINLKKVEDISSSNPIEAKEKLVFPCNLCQYIATQNGHLKRHVLSKHCLERFECRFCLKIFTFYESLRRHVKEYHEGPQIFPCPECNFAARRQETLNYHVQWKHSEEKVTCDECGHQAGTERLLKRHKLRVHSGVKYLCDKCSYQTSDKGSFSYHQKSKHDNIRFQCDICTMYQKIH